MSTTDDNGRAHVAGEHYSRNSFRKIWFYNVDLRLSTIFRFGRSFEAEIIAEGFNILGADNLRSTDTRLVRSNGDLDDTFNEKNIAGSPRQYQLGLKLRF